MKRITLITTLLAATFLLNSCGDAPTPAERDQIINLSNEIADLSRINEGLSAEYPVQQQAVDTLLKFLNTTEHQYTKNILIKEIAAIQTDIEKKRNDIATNAIKIDQDKISLRRIVTKDQQVLLDDTSRIVVGGDTIQKFIVTDSTKK